MTNESQNHGQGKNEQQTQPQQTQQPTYNGIPMYRQTGYPVQQTPAYPYQGTVAPTPYTAAPPPQAQNFTGGFPGVGTMPPGSGPLTQGGTPISPQQGGTIPLPAVQQSYIENILRMNLEKVATVYMTFEHEGGAESKAFRGEVEAAGRDHVIINDNKTGTRYLLPLIYLDYVTFQGPINYYYPYA